MLISCLKQSGSRDLKRSFPKKSWKFVGEIGDGVSEDSAV